MHTNAIEHPETFSIGTTFEMFVDQMFEFTVHNVIFVSFYPATCVCVCVCALYALWHFGVVRFSYVDVVSLVDFIRIQV